jgi:tetratricopeptide (TPR) repeat protein
MAMDRPKGLLGQLQERHVPRTAVLYLGAGWVALEFIGFVVDNYALDRALLDCSLLLIAIGFPVALIVSWFHGAEGRQPITRVESVLVGTLLLVGVLGSTWIVSRERPEPRAPALAPAGMLPADLGEGSLAVLPLTNRTGADSLNWLGPGLADMLTTNLAQFGDLRVVSAQRLLDLMRQAGREETEEIPEDLALQIASQSGARSLVRGAFMTAGDEVRLDVQLIDLRDGTITAAERSSGSDVFALVDDVSAKLSSRLLGAAFTPTELTPVTRLATGSLEAYREYQEGLLSERRFLLEQAEGHYRRAVDLDPTFALAWLQLGMLDNVAGQDAILAFQNADVHKDKASERDRLLIEAMFAANLSRDFEAADSLLRELIDRFPEEKEARYQLGVFYDGSGRAEEGRRVIEEAVTLDPYYAPGVNHLAYMAGRVGDSIGADTLSMRYLELEPDQANPHDSRGEILEMIGRNEDARDEFREALRIEPGFLASYEHLVRSYLREGDAVGARTELRPYMDTEDSDASVLSRRLEGDTYVAEGRYRDGLAAYRDAAERAAELNRDDLRMQPLLEWAGTATFTGSHGEAEAALRQADAIDRMSGGVFLNMLVLEGERGRLDGMLEVRDSAVIRFAETPALLADRTGFLLLVADALIAFYQEDAEAAIQMFDAARDAVAIPRPHPLAATTHEALALLEVGRAGDALALAEHMERASGAGNRLDPGDWHAALYIKGRAHEALGNQSSAVGAYEKLLDMAGDGVHEIALFSEVPDRVSALRQTIEAQASG